LLITVHRKLVFIHDTYIYASIINYALLKSIIAYYINTVSRDKKNVEFLEELRSLLKDEDLIKMLNKGFYEKLGSSEESLAYLKEFLEKFKLYPSIEYSTRAYPRSLLKEFAERELLWIIPYRSIKKIQRRKISGRDSLEIIYACPLTNKIRILRTYYDHEIYMKIKQLCLFNGNDRC